MFANVLTSAASWSSEQSLLTYLVPEAMEAELRRGQLVSVPYGERLVEGIVWDILAEGQVELDQDIVLRPLHGILDSEPALLPHQQELAVWISEYYITPLSQVTLLMLTRGLMQRSQFVLRLVEESLVNANEQDVPLQVRALIGLLLADGTQDVEQFKKMLGPKRAREFLKEALASGLIEREARLEAPKAKARIKRIVRLIAQGEALTTWREQTEIVLQQSILQTEKDTTSDSIQSSPQTESKGGRRRHVFDLMGSSTATLAPVALNKVGLVAQHQLAAINLLLNSGASEKGVESYWTPNKLCQASKLTAAQLQQLVDEHILLIEQVEIQRDPLLGRTITPSTPLALTADQQRTLNCILEDLEASEEAPKPILLHGVTGSGKTEVYLQALAEVIARGKRGIVLVPEIALTTQAIQRVASRFPGRVAIIHSALSLGERYDEWRRIRAGKVDVVVGPRAALFAPVADLGIIILDEEHESAYKQEEIRPTYHAREVALVLGQILRIPVVLGSATPSVESFYRAEQGHYRLVELPSRIGASLPPVEIIDLREELHAGNTSIISRRLQEELERVLSLGQQAILFLNRRGAASCVLCRDCGFVAICDLCDMPLTYHSTESVLLCHYCGGEKEVLQFCPVCRSSGIRYFGLGTEKVQDTLQRSFPNARLLRWDRDTAKNRHAHEQLLDRFANREADILVGTQMIAKGLDLPGVTLVGVVSADIALNLPDYSSPERTFTLLTQVAGRAGRGEEAGRVIIQTFNPQHFCIDAASRHDYAGFYAMEIETRRRYGYPPFRQFVKFTYSHSNRYRCQNEALLLCERLNEEIERLKLEDTDIVGPAPALLGRIKGKYRWQMVVRGPDLHPLMHRIDAPGWQIDIDPVSTL
jgi:primosomal protein N' (replication factor Y) (superfamily II helicase)